MKKDKIKGIPFREEDEPSEHFSQYEITAKPDGKVRLTRFFLILIYAAFSAGYVMLFTVVTKMAALIAILPFFLWMLWYFTWKHTQIEYAYVICRGEFHIYRVNGYGNATEVLFRQISDCEAAFPASDTGKLAGIGSKLFYASAPESANLYAAIWQINGKRTAVYFDASSKLLSSMRYYGGDSVTVSELTR